MPLLDIIDKSFPELYLLKQKLKKTKISDTKGYTATALEYGGFKDFVKSGYKVGICVGSRGISNLRDITSVVVEKVREQGATPIIIPAMGSHGGATAQGQTEILNSYDINEVSVGAPVVSSMEVINLEDVQNDIKVYFDKAASQCDAIICINRVKSHTDFSSDVESGIIKMLSIGMGNHIGASYIHNFGTKGLIRHIPLISKKIIENFRISGLGIVENGFGETEEISFMVGNKIFEQEPQLLKLQKKLKAKIPFNRLDYLLIEELGKNISGTGADTKVIGRIKIKGIEDPASPDPYIIAGLSLTEDSHGNAIGVGLCDIITKRFFDSIDYSVTITNSETCKFPERSKIPIFMENDYKSIMLGFEFSKVSGFFEDKITVIKNTMDLEYMYISKNLIDEIKGCDSFEVIKQEPVKLKFNNNNYISLFT